MEPKDTHTNGLPLPARLNPRRSRPGRIGIIRARRIVALLVTVALAALAGGIAAVVLITSQPHAPEGGAVAPTAPAPPPAGITAPDPTAPSVPASSEVAVAAGHALAGNGTGAVSLDRAEELSNAVPAGAAVDPRTNTLRFTTRTVRLAIVASPPGADMKFRIAGMNDPTIELPRDAQVTVELINADNDMAHMWILAAGTGSDDGTLDDGGSGIAAAPPLGDPTGAGQPTETVTFTVPAPGTYHYYCAFPGHAAQGMRGRLIVRA